MAGKYDNRNRDSSDFKFKNNDPFNEMKKTTKKKSTAKKVVKKVLKKVPGPIGTVARVGSIARKLSNAAKNKKNLKPLKKGVGFPKATKKQMASFKKAMDLKSPALKKVYEANKKAKTTNVKDARKLKKAKGLKNKRVSKMNKEINKGINPFPMRVDTRHGGASDAGRSSEGSTKHLLRSVRKAKDDFKKKYKVKTVKGNPGKFKSRDYLKKIKKQVMKGQ